MQRLSRRLAQRTMGKRPASSLVHRVTIAVPSMQGMDDLRPGLR